MPAYMVGRLDQLQKTVRIIGNVILVVAFIAIVMNIPGRLLYGTVIGEWLYENDLSLSGACFIGWLFLIPATDRKIPRLVRNRQREKIIRLRIALGCWPDYEDMPHDQRAKVTADKIAIASEQLKQDITKWPYHSLRRDA